MIISSVLIGGTEFVSKTLIRGFQLQDEISDRLGTCELTVFGTPADLAASLIPGAIVEIQYGGSSSSTVDDPEFGLIVFGEAVFGGGTTTVTVAGTRLFYGRIVSVEPLADTVGTAGTGYTEFALTCRNYADLLNNIVVSTAITYTSQTDAAIIADLLTTYLPEIGSSGVDTTATLPTVSFDNVTLRAALETLAQLTGANYWVDVNKVLQYHLPSTTAAPFGFSETPDNVTTFNPLYKPKILWDFTNGANRVKVIGALGSGGAPITSIKNDATSQGLYGIKSRVIVDRSITTTGQADARANTELANYSNPLMTGTLQTYLDGLKLGQYIALNLPAVNVIGSYQIVKVTATWPSPTQTLWSIDFGAYLPNLAAAVRNALTQVNQAPQTPIAVPAPASITPVGFASTIQAIGIVNTLPTLPDSNYPDASVVVLTTDRKLYRNNSGTWTAAVPTTDLTGQVTNTQIADNSISTPKLQALSVTASVLAAAAVTAGKIDVDAVTAGTIAAGAIRASDAVFAAAAIQTADIANAAITNAKVSNLDAGSITTGTMIADRISAGTISLGGGSLNIVGGDSKGIHIFGSFSGSVVAFDPMVVQSGLHMIVDANANLFAQTAIKIGSLFVPAVDSTGTRIKFGIGTFSGGTATISTGLSSVGNMQLTVAGNEYGYLVSASGGSVSVASSNGSSTSGFDWLAIGT